MEVHERVVALVAEMSGVPAEKITPGSPIGNEPMQSIYDPDAKCDPLDLDSLDRVDLAVALERTFDIALTDDELTDHKHGTVGGLVALVNDKLTEELTLNQPATAMQIAAQADRGALAIVRRAFDAGVTAGRCDPNPNPAFQAFLSREHLA